MTKLHVVIKRADDYDINFWGRFTERLVTIDLTDEQIKQLKLRDECERICNVFFNETKDGAI